MQVFASVRNLPPPNIALLFPAIRTLPCALLLIPVVMSDECAPD